MTTEQDFIAFEGDVCRDMLTYRLTELSLGVVETAFEQDVQLAEKYAVWLRDVAEKEEKKPIILYDISFDADSVIQIFAMPTENTFFITFKTDRFEASVSMAYDADRMDVSAVRIVMFSGSPSFALSWAEAVRATLDDMLMDKMNATGELK